MVAGKVYIPKILELTSNGVLRWLYDSEKRAYELRGSGYKLILNRMHDLDATLTIVKYLPVSSKITVYSDENNECISQLYDAACKYATSKVVVCEEYNDFIDILKKVSETTYPTKA